MKIQTPDIVLVVAEEEVFVVDFANGWRLYVPYEWYFLDKKTTHLRVRRVVFAVI